METVIYTRKGEKHKENQDVCFVNENELFYFWSLSDGVSGCIEALKGAVIACRTAARMFMREDRMLLKSDKKEAVSWLMEEIKYELKEYNTGSQNDIRDYASTLMFILIDKKEKELYTFNLGDGICRAVSDEYCMDITPFSDSIGGSYATTTANVEDKVFFEKQAVSKWNLLLMMTDGAWEIMKHNSELKQQYIRLLTDKNYDGLKIIFDKARPEDDCSFIAIDLSAIRLKGDL